MGKMIIDKEHNKFTTTYFLLIKKASRGELKEELKNITIKPVIDQDLEDDKIDLMNNRRFSRGSRRSVNSNTKQNESHSQDQHTRLLISPAKEMFSHKRNYTLGNRRKPSTDSVNGSEKRNNLNKDSKEKERLVEREKITERERWFTNDNTVKFKEVITEKERFSVEESSNHNNKDNACHYRRNYRSPGTRDDHERINIQNTPKSNMAKSNGSNYHSKEKPINNQKDMMVTNNNVNNGSYSNKKNDSKGVTVKDFPKISCRNTPNSGHHTNKAALTNNSLIVGNRINESGVTMRKFPDNNFPIDLRRKSSNNSYTNWGPNKTQHTANTPQQINFERRNLSLDTNKNTTNLSVSPNPIRLNRE